MYNLWLQILSTTNQTTSFLKSVATILSYAYQRSKVCTWKWKDTNYGESAVAVADINNNNSNKHSPDLVNEPKRLTPKDQWISSFNSFIRN